MTHAMQWRRLIRKASGLRLREDTRARRLGAHGSGSEMRAAATTSCSQRRLLRENRAHGWIMTVFDFEATRRLPRAHWLVPVRMASHRLRSLRLAASSLKQTTYDCSMSILCGCNERSESSLTILCIGNHRKIAISLMSEEEVHTCLMSVLAGDKKARGPTPLSGVNSRPRLEQDAGAELVTVLGSGHEKKKLGV